jgi:hypothetical protein
LINYTKINESLSQKPENVEGVFPRWAALSRVFNPSEMEKSTSAFMVAGVKSILYYFYQLLIEFKTGKGYWSCLGLSKYYLRKGLDGSSVGYSRYFEFEGRRLN